MFENLLGQPGLVEELQRGIQDQTLPGALLIYGPRYAGKLTVALELARVLNCHVPGAPWACTCSSCKHHRLLMSPHTLMFGPRYFLSELHMTGNAVIHEDRESTRYGFYRAVRKLTNRFEPVLWEGEEQKIQKVPNILDAINQEIEPIHPEAGGFLGPTAAEKTMSKVIQECEKLIAQVPAEGFSVNMIRRASYWAHMTSDANRKVIILEAADKLNESSRNSLLKILEEPPENTHFILTTSRLTGIIPTLRSRLRTYHCGDRPKDIELQVLERIFRLSNLEVKDSSASPLEQAFDQVRREYMAEANRQVQVFLESLNQTSGAYTQIISIQDWIESLSPAIRRDTMVYFLSKTKEELVHQIQWSNRTEDQARTTSKATRVLQEIEVQYERMELYNIPAASAIDQIFFAAADLKRLES